MHSEVYVSFDNCCAEKETILKAILWYQKISTQRKPLDITK
jgi:hypothetical protein